MRLLNLNKYLFIYLFIFSTILLAEDSVDIWKKDNNKIKNLDVPTVEQSKEESKLKNIEIKKNSNNVQIEITEGIEKESIQNLYGIYDPDENDLSLNMWEKGCKAVEERVNQHFGKYVTGKSFACIAETLDAKDGIEIFMDNIKVIYKIV